MSYPSRRRLLLCSTLNDQKKIFSEQSLARPLETSFLKSRIGPNDFIWSIEQGEGGTLGHQLLGSCFLFPNLTLWILFWSLNSALANQGKCDWRRLTRSQGINDSVLSTDWRDWNVCVCQLLRNVARLHHLKRIQYFLHAKQTPCAPVTNVT